MGIFALVQPATARLKNQSDPSTSPCYSLHACLSASRPGCWHTYGLWCGFTQKKRGGKNEKEQVRWSAVMVRLVFSLHNLWVIWEPVNKLSSEMAPYQITGLYCALHTQPVTSPGAGDHNSSFTPYLAFDIEAQRSSRARFKPNWLSQAAEGKRQALTFSLEMNSSHSGSVADELL